MKKSLILVPAFSLVLSSLFAQNDNKQISYFMDKVNVVSSDSRIEVDSRGDTVLVSEFLSRNVKNQSRQDFIKIYKGTPFFKNKWFMGQMRMKNGEMVKGTMALNLVGNVVYFSVGSTAESVEVKPDEIILGGVRLLKQKDVFDNAFDYYYETVYNEKSVILSQPICKYTPKVTGPNTGYEASGDNFEGYFEKSEKLYFGTGDMLTLIRTNSRFYDLFGEHKKTIQEYVSGNKLSLKSKADVVKIVRYYDSINVKL